MDAESPRFAQAWQVELRSHLPFRGTLPVQRTPCTGDIYLRSIAKLLVRERCEIRHFLKIAKPLVRAKWLSSLKLATQAKTYMSRG